MKITHKELEYLIELLENHIYEQKQMHKDVMGPGGPANPRSAELMQSFHKKEIETSKRLLEKLEKVLI